MWLLIMVLLIAPGIKKIVVLHTYDTSQECQRERDRIGSEMQAAYPEDHDDFALACQMDRKQRA